MSFLSPLFLLGGLAVGLPILFHLIRRTSKERTRFSSLMFISPTPPRVTRRSRLENLLLLIFRCCVLALLAFAFARPYTNRKNDPTPVAEGSTKVAVVIDQSASMRRAGLWDQAVAKAQEVLQKLAPGDQAMVLSYDRQVRTIVSFEEWNKMEPSQRVASVVQNLKSITPTWLGTDLANALTSAADALENDTKDQEIPSPLEVVVIGDLQEGSRLEAIQGYEWPHGMVVTLAPLQKKSSNAGLQLVLDNRDIGLASGEGGPRVRVLNATDSQKEQFQLQWEGAADAAQIYVPAGQSRIVQMSKPPVQAGAHKLVLRGDDEDFDNTIYYSEPIAEKIPVLYFGSEGPADQAEPLYFVKVAFDQSKRQSVELAVHRPSADFSAIELERSSLMLVTEELPENQVSAARKFMEEGKTVLLLLRSSSMGHTLAGLLKSPEFPIGEAPQDDRGAMFGKVDFTHPLFADFSGPQFSDFTKFRFWKHRSLSADRLPGAHVLVEFDNEDPAILEVTVGKGSLVVMTAGWQPIDSQFGRSSKFVGFIYSLLEMSGSLKTQKVQYAVGDDVNFGIAIRSNNQEIKKPDGSVVKLLPETRFSSADQPGAYTITSMQPPQTFTVNLDSLESKTGALTPEDFERFNVPLKKVKSEALVKHIETQRRQYLVREMENQQKLWRRFILAAFIIVVIETLIAAWQTRRVTASYETSPA